MDKGALYTHITNTGNARVILGNVYGTIPEDYCNSPGLITTKILGLLNFHQREDRHEEIADAHRKTFEWIFHENSNATLPWPSFVDFLTTGQGVYWIRGKLGSGKSTLMKFLCEHPRTYEALQVWSQGKPVSVLKFFFWKSGTELQRNQTGLLRSILYQAIQKHPEIGPQIFPEMYNQLVDWSCFPSTRDLKSGCRKLLTLASPDFRLVYFIDGLDEYEMSVDGSFDFDDLFGSKVVSSSVKIVVSSRPLGMFEETFKLVPKLSLHQLTEEDIRAYVNECLIDRLNGGVEEEYHTQILSAINDQITSRADGVFLWVKFAVRSILDGVLNGDSDEELTRRLQELPSELEGMFHHMLRICPQRYQIEQSKMLQIVLQDSKLSGLIAFTPLDMSFALEDAEQAMKSPIQPLTYREARDRVSKVEKRVKVCCGGLLELVEVTWRDELDVLSHNDIVADSPGYNIWLNRITFTHRSVAEFLQQSQMPSIYPKQDSFDALSAILNSKLRLLKCRRAVSKLKISTILYDLKLFLSPLLHIDEFIRFKWYDELDNVLTQTNGYSTRPDGYLTWEVTDIMGFAANMYMHKYLHYKLTQDFPCTTTNPDLLLFNACSRSPRDMYQPWASLARLETIKYLLQIGANPNHRIYVDPPYQSKWRGSRQALQDTIFDHAIERELEFIRYSDVEIMKETMHHRMHALKALIEYGADPNELTMFPITTRGPSEIVVVFSSLGLLEVLDCVSQWIFESQRNYEAWQAFQLTRLAEGELHDAIETFRAAGAKSCVWRLVPTSLESFTSDLSKILLDKREQIHRLLHSDRDKERLDENYELHRLHKGSPQFMDMLDQYFSDSYPKR